MRDEPRFDMLNGYGHDLFERQRGHTLCETGHVSV